MLELFRWTALFAAVVLLVAIVGAIVVSSSQPSDQPSEQQAAEKNKTENSTNKNDKTLWDSWFPDSISLYTLFLAVFTAVLAVGGIYQLKFLGRAEQIAATAANAAKDSAKAAKNAVELSDKTAEKQLRAYVSIISGAMTLVNLTEGGLGISIHVVLRNSGQTPGYKFTTWIKEPKILEPTAIPFTEPTPIAERAGMSVIGPGGDVHINWILPSTPEMREAITKGTINVFVWGGADYTDAFGKERYFIFRDLNTTGSRFGVAGDTLGLRPHKLGYDAN